MKIFKKLNKFLNQILFNSDKTLNQSITHLESVMNRRFVTVMKSTDEYVSGQRINRRIVLLIVVRVLVLIYALRFGLSAFINKVLNKILTCLYTC